MATLEETMLILVSGAENNNKFYHVTLHDDDTVTARWGRVGVEGTVSNKGSGRHTYDRCIREKERKGYKRTDIEASTTKAISGGNGTNGVDVEVAALASLMPANVTADARAALDTFIRRIVAENRHAITSASGGLITVSDDGIVRTALGVVSLGNIQKARVILNRLANQTDSGSGVSQKDLDEYLTYIPQKVPARRGWGDTFLTKVTTIDKQRDLLDQLESSVALAKTATAKALADAQKAAQTSTPTIDFRYALDVLDPKGKEFKRISKMFEDTKNDRHHRDVAGLKLKRVYVVTDSDEHLAKWKDAKDKLSNVRELWHGTLTGNLLSILRKGLFVPPVRGTTIRIAGRMFGDGIYFSDQSTKSLRYSAGSWGGATGGSRDNCFMLLNEVVLGNEFRPYQQGGWAGSASLNKAHNSVDAKGKPFNSINIKGGTCGVLNNEIVVWDVEQIRVSYICEFDK
jgi:poly [ADP-ribose] polymerase